MEKESWSVKRIREATDPSLEDIGNVEEFEPPEDRHSKVLQKIRDMAAQGRKLYVTNLQIVSAAIRLDDQTVIDDLTRDESLSLDDLQVIRELLLVGAFGFPTECQDNENSYEISSMGNFKYIHLYIIQGDTYADSILYNDPEFLKLVDFTG